MPAAKLPVIIQFDPDPYYKIGTELLLERVGYKLTLNVNTQKQAKQVMEEIKAGRLQPDVVIVTDYLATGFRDGQQVAKKLKEVGSTAKVLAHLIDDEEPEWSDAYAIKAGLDTEKTLLIALGELLGKDLRAESRQADTS